VATPKENPRNDRLYTHVSTKKKDVATKRLRTWSTFSQSLTASVVESQMVWQYTNLTLVYHEIRVSEAYCRKSLVLQLQQFHRHTDLSDLKRVLFFTFQQGGHPAHMPLQTINILISNFSRCWPILKILSKQTHQQECGPMPNVTVALPNIGGAPCSCAQRGSLADACCWSAVQ